MLRGRRGGPGAAHRLLFFRFLRLAGVALSLGFFVILGLMTTLVPFNGNPSLQSEQLFVTSVIASFACLTIGIPLMLIGNKISPPDPWLDPWLSPFRGRKSRKPYVTDELVEDGAISAIIQTEKDMSRTRWRLRNGEKCYVKLRDGLLFLEPPGRDLVWIEPKTVLRIGGVTLLLDTGRWNYGKITLTFDSASDAERIEHEARQMLGQCV